MNDGDVLRIGGQDPGVIVTLLYQWPAQAAMQTHKQEIPFGEKNLVQIGRDGAMKLYWIHRSSHVSTLRLNVLGSAIVCAI
jgi:hypothetical protein